MPTQPLQVNIYSDADVQRMLTQWARALQVSCPDPMGGGCIGAEKCPRCAFRNADLSPLTARTFKHLLEEF